MKRYNLTCPFCGEENSISMKANAPEELSCEECDELDLEQIRKIVDGWKEYFLDLDDMLEMEKGKGKR